MAVTVNENVGVIDSSSPLVSDTNRRIIYGALRLVGAYASSDKPRQEQVDDAQEALVMMLKFLQTKLWTWLRTSVTITATSGAQSYSLPFARKAMFRPTRIFNVLRVNSSGTSIPMQAISRTDYEAIPNKSATGTPVQYYYDPQLEHGKLYVWPTFDNATDTLIVSCDKPLYADTDLAEFPGEHMEMIKWGLACRIGPEYGIEIQQQQMLEQQYTAFEQQLLDYDREPVSVFFGVGR